jgi:bifunctional Delta-12/omega-3 fatty acid desaturase
MGTVDRTIGFIGRHFMHDIIDYHLVHHLFSRIPFYHAEEATKAIMPLLGERYVEAKDDSFMWSLYTTFKSCNFVAERKGGGEGKLWWATRRVDGAS